MLEEESQGNLPCLKSMVMPLRLIMKLLLMIHPLRQSITLFPIIFMSLIQLKRLETINMSYVKNRLQLT